MSFEQLINEQLDQCWNSCQRRDRLELRLAQRLTEMMLVVNIYFLVPIQFIVFTILILSLFNKRHILNGIITAPMRLANLRIGSFDQAKVG